MTSISYYIFNFEIIFNYLIQAHISPGLLIIFELFAEYLSPCNLIMFAVPLIGAYDMELMAKSTFLIGSINLISSIVKWIYPEDRPYWWVREFNKKPLRQHRLTCETTTGFPSGHSAAFTGFVQMIYYFLSPKLQNKLLLKNTMLAVVIMLCLIMWASRLYFGCHFLHQCLVGSLGAFYLIKWVNKNDIMLWNMESKKGIIILSILGCIAVASFIIIQQMGLDPHWSVRMAFKWCDNPEWPSHESSPVYTLVRDFGFMLGLLISLPFTDKVQTDLNHMRSFPIALTIMGVNFILQKWTPKNYGRFVFVGYGFVKNILYSYTLLNAVPKYGLKDLSKNWKTL